MNRIIILMDYRNYFWKTTRLRDDSFDVGRMIRKFSSQGFKDVSVKSFTEIDLRESYDGVYVLYTSSEDPGIHYRSYVEDILLGLKLRGAVLVPHFKLLHAHHNKVFMEILRCVALTDEYEKLPAQWYGCLEEYEKWGAGPEFSVFKRSDGSGSRTVRLMDKKHGEYLVPKSIIRSFDLKLFVTDSIKSIWSSRYPKFCRNSQYRKKFIVQRFLPNLKADFKVLVFGERCFVLERKVRNNDFRASGSGKFSFPESPDRTMLDYAYNIKERLGSPFLSLDIARVDDEYVLIEFQGVHFGPYTVEKSKYHFVKKNGGWDRVDSETFVEDVLAESVVEFIRK